MPYEAIDKAAYDYEQRQAEVLRRRGDTDFMEALAGHDADSIQAEPQGPAGCDSDACLLPPAKPQ